MEVDILHKYIKKEADPRQQARRGLAGLAVLVRYLPLGWWVGEFWRCKPCVIPKLANFFLRMDISRASELASHVDGWLSLGEGKMLYRLAQRCTGQGVIVEIGSWQGKSTIWLGAGSQAGRQTRIFAIDPHTGSAEHKANGGPVWTFEAFQRNIRNAGVEGLITPLLKPSANAVNDVRAPIELLFIDGAHDYESVKQDFELWFPKVIDGGFVAFHDTIHWPGPRKVVAENVYRSHRFRGANFIHSLTYAQKVAENTTFERFQNRCRLGLKNGYDLVHSVLIQPPVYNLLAKLIGKH